MSGFAQRRRFADGLDRMPKKYDIRVVDHFYAYCQAVARTHRHQDEVRAQAEFATRRTLASMLVVGGLLCYYVVDRFWQVLL